MISNEPGEELQLDFTGDLISNKLQNHPKHLVAVDHFSKWTTAKICNNTETKTVSKFLEPLFNLHGVPKRIRTDNDTAFKIKEFNDFCYQYNIERITGLPYIHTATGLVGRTIQSLKNLILTKLEDGIGLVEGINRALYVMRFTIHTGKGKTLIRITSRTILINLTSRQTSLLSAWKTFCNLENPERLPVYITRDKEGNISDYLVMPTKKIEPEKPKTGTPTLKQKTTLILVNENKFPYYFVERNHRKESFESKKKPKLQKAVSETKHTKLTERTEEYTKTK